MSARNAKVAIRSLRWRLWLSSATVVAFLQLALVAQASDVERVGPWAFADRINEKTHAPEHMAVTPAAEDNDIWLLLACSQSRFTASLMHGVGFPYVVGATAKLILRAKNFPTVSVKAESVQEKQLTIDAATSRHLMPLFLGSENIVVTVPDPGDVTRDYTFSLQPNGRSLARIVRDCWTDD